MRWVPLVLVLLILPSLAGCTDLLEAMGGGGGRPPRVQYEAVQFETSLGAFTAILYPDAAPETVAFFKRLVGEGYYDGREFNRIIPGFVIQEVDRAGGATDEPERVPLEAETNVHFSMGAFGIARDVDPNSGGSEFFVMDFAHSHLYRNFTAFAQVVHGMEVIHAIARVDAINTREGPLGQLPGSPVPLPVGVHDRIAVQPAVIQKAVVTTTELPRDVAAQFPRVVGERTVVESPPTRYTPEWPANLAVGNLSALTWYVYTPADEPPPDLRSAIAVVERPDGPPLRIAPLADPADVRILHWTWTPSAPGAHAIALEIGGTIVARNALDVP